MIDKPQRWSVEEELLGQKRILYKIARNTEVRFVRVSKDFPVI
jgi:hypothetical protein